MVHAADPDGVEWEVERLWAAWKVRFRLSLFAPGFDLTTLILLVACALWFPFEWLLSHLAGTALHLFDRPWRVVATTRTPVRRQLTWLVRGYAASMEAVGEIAERIGAGDPELWRDADRRRTLDAPDGAAGPAAQPDRSDASTRPRSSA